MEDDTAQVREIDPMWGNVLSVWWLFAWRGFLGGMLIGGIVAFIWLLVVSSLGMSFDVMATGIGGAIIGLLWSVIVCRMALRKKYRTFRIALMPLEH